MLQEQKKVQKMFKNDAIREKRHKRILKDTKNTKTLQNGNIDSKEYEKIQKRQEEVAGITMGTKNTKIQKTKKRIQKWYRKEEKDTKMMEKDAKTKNKSYRTMKNHAKKKKM